MEAVCDDYARSERELTGIADPATGSLLAPGNSVSTPRAAMAALLAHVDATHGGVESYLSTAGLSTDDMSAIRRNLLFHPAEAGAAASPEGPLGDAADPAGRSA